MGRIKYVCMYCTVLQSQGDFNKNSFNIRVAAFEGQPHCDWLKVPREKFDFTSTVIGQKNNGSLGCAGKSMLVPCSFDRSRHVGSIVKRFL